MKSLRLAIVALMAVTAPACQSGEANENHAAAAKVGPVSTVGPAYAKDIQTLCDAVTGSGADKEDASARQLLIANYLAANLKTEDSRKFLVHIQPMVGNEKAKALEDEATRLGLSGCALAAEWKQPS